MDILSFMELLSKTSVLVLYSLSLCFNKEKTELDSKVVKTDFIWKNYSNRGKDLHIEQGSIPNIAGASGNL